MKTETLQNITIDLVAIYELHNTPEQKRSMW